MTPNSFFKRSGLLLASSLMEKIPNLFNRALVRLPIPQKSVKFGMFQTLLVMCSDTEDIQQEISASETRMVELTDLVDSLIYENSRVVQDQKTYQEKYNRYSQEYKDLEQKLETLTNSLQKKKSQAKSIKEFIQHLSNRDLVSEFDEKLWYTMVEKVIIASKEEVDFHFKNGAVISI